jgi:murein DD-endopeptidase MepM/ murein hydrolase activator NlpD
MSFMAAVAVTKRWSGEVVRELARSYAQILFAHSPWVGLLLLVATASHPTTFVLGLTAVVEASIVAKAFDFDVQLRTTGYFGYNAFLVGAGIGHLWAGSWLCLPIAVVACALAVVLTATARALFTRHLGLPALSLPFLAAFWLVTWAAPLLGASPSPAVVEHVDLGVPAAFAHFLECLGAIFFVPTVTGGAVVALALFVHSRIASLLALGTFALVAVVSLALPSPISPSSFDGLAANAMLLSIAVAGVWFVPSRWSALWACGASLACVLVTVAIERPLSSVGIPVLFAPFNLISYAVLLAARERTQDQRPTSVDFVAGSPEENRAYVLEQRLRFPLSHGFAFQLPFRGRWTCTQGVDGQHTHQGPWRHAFDFQVLNDDGQLFVGSPEELTNYHGFRLPVLAAAAGVVVKVEDELPDNPIGNMDLIHNWGNLVVLQHGPGVYSLVAHLARRSVKVKEGQHVAAGEVLGLCGNSGRSPTPHIHFHLQVGLQPGSATLPSSFTALVRASMIGETLELSHTPAQNDVCRNLEPNGDLANRLALRPGQQWRAHGDVVEEMTVDIDLYGRTRVRSQRASLGCLQSPQGLRMLDLSGNRRSQLSLMRAAMPTVPFEDNPSLLWKDYVPVSGLPGRSVVQRFVSFILPPSPLLMRYALHKAAGYLVIEGESVRRDHRELPLLRTRIVVDNKDGPVSIELRHGRRTATASRTGAAARPTIVPSSAPRAFTEPTRGLPESVSQPEDLN